MRLPGILSRDHHMREVVHGASITLCIKIVVGLLTFTLNVVAARVLGADGAGLFFLALTVTTIAGVLGRLGLDAAVVRLVAGAAATGQWGRVKGVARDARAITAVSSIGLAGAVALSAGWMSTVVFGKPELEPTLRWMAIAIAPFALAQLHSQLLKGLKQILFSQLSLAALPAVAVPAIMILGPRHGSTGASVGYAVAAVVAAAVSLLLWRASMRSRAEARDDADRSELLSVAPPLLAMSAFTLVMMWSAPFLLGVWRPASDVAVYNVAFRTALLTTLVLTAVNSIAAPKFAELYRTQDLEALGATARNSARMMAVVAFPVLILFVAVPSFIMRIFGPEFVTGSSVLMVLAIGQFVNVATGSVGFVLIMTGRERMARNNTAVAAIVNVGLQVLLIPRYGALGAAVATTVSVTVLNLRAAYLVHRSLGIMTLPFRLREAE